MTSSLGWTSILSRKLHEQVQHSVHSASVLAAFCLSDKVIVVVFVFGMPLFNLQIITAAFICRICHDPFRDI